MRAHVLASALLVSALSAAAALAQSQSDLVKRGEYLMNGPVACGNCHHTRGPDLAVIPGMEYAGGFKLVDPGLEAYTANITQDKDTGIGTWTDEQIITAIREGRSREGKIIFPPMPVPTYNNMADEDVRAMVAYLRTVKPVHHEVPESKYSFPQQAMPPAKSQPIPPKSDKIGYGRYIVTAQAHCFECHSGPSDKGPPDFEHKLAAGGFPITLGPDMVVVTANITPDPETGIGKWTDAEIKTAMTTGVRPGGRHLSPPMPYPFFKNMTDEDIDAVIAFLRTIPPIRNAVERTDFQKKVFN